MRRNIFASLLWTVLLKDTWSAVTLRDISWPANPLPKRDFFLRIVVPFDERDRR